MNKLGFVSALQLKTGLNEKQCFEIDKILESHFIFSKKNKQKVVEELVEKLGFEYTQAEDIFDISLTIINDEIENVKKHPFGKRD